MTEPNFTGKRLIIMRHGNKDSRPMAAHQAIDIASQLHEAGIDHVDAINHSPIGRAERTAQYLHQAFSPELSQHFTSKSGNEPARAAPILEVSEELHNAAGLYEDRQFDYLRGLDDGIETIILVAHAENIDTIEKALGYGMEADNAPEDVMDPKLMDLNYATHGYTVMYDLDIQSWAELTPDPVLVKRTNAFIPDEANFVDPANKQVFEGIEL